MKKWDQAQEYLLKALGIFAEYNDQHNIAVTIQNITRIFQVHPTDQLITEMARILSISEKQVKALLQANAPEKGASTTE